jgi:hypothetical protein
MLFKKCGYFSPRSVSSEREYLKKEISLITSIFEGYSSQVFTERIDENKIMTGLSSVLRLLSPLFQISGQIYKRFIVPPR